MPPEPPAPPTPKGAGVPEYSFGAGSVLAADGRMWPALVISFGPLAIQVIGPPEVWPAIKASIVANLDEAMTEAAKAGSRIMIAQTMPPEPAPSRSALVHP